MQVHRGLSRSVVSMTYLHLYRPVLFYKDCHLLVDVFILPLATLLALLSTSSISLSISFTTAENGKVCDLTPAAVKVV